MGMDGNAIRAVLQADTGQFNAAMGQAGAVTEKEMTRIRAQLKYVADQLKSQESAAKQAANTMRQAASEEVEAAQRVAGGHAGVTRELLVLTHEMSQGNFSRFGGSMLVLGERIDIMGKLASPAGAAIGALGLAVGAAAAFMVKGQIEANQFTKALQATGNFAGATGDSFMELSRKTAEAAGISTSTARDIVKGLTATGRIGPQVMEQAATAIAKYQFETGKTTEEVITLFAKMGDGVAKWAEENNKSMHYLSASQYLYIRSLEETKGVEAAELENLRLFNERAPVASGWWHDLAKGVSDFFHSFGGTQSIQDQIDLIKQMRDRQDAQSSKKGDYFGPGAMSMPSLVDRDSLNEDMRLLARQRADQMSAARDIAEAAKRSEEGIAARGYVEEVLKRSKATTEYARAIAHYREEVEKAAKAGTPFSPQQIAEGEAQIKKDNTPKTEVKAENEYGNLTAQVKAYNIATQQEADSYQRLSEAQKWSIQMHEALDKAAKNLGATRTKEIAGLVDQAAAERAAADAEVESRKRVIAAVVEQTAKDEQQVANGAAFLAAGEEKVSALIRQTAQIGLYGEALKEKQALDEIDTALMKANIGATAEQRAQNELSAAQLRDHTITALRDGKKAQEDFDASFENGAQKAFKAYSDAAANNAALAEEVVGHSMSSMEDALTQFVMTGKLNFKSLADSIIADLIRIQTKKAIISLIESLTSGGGGDSGAGSAAVGGWTAAMGYANGISYVPYDGFPAYLHEGEQVVSKQDVQRGNAPVIHMGDTQLTVGAGVNMQQMNAALQANNVAMEGRIRRLTATGAIS